MSSLYAQYLRERSNVSIVENEHGYITYIFMKDYCYIEDVFVTPEKRGTRLASQLAEQVLIKAKENGYSRLLGSVCISANGAEKSVVYMINYGYKLHNLDKDMIYFVKEI